MAELVEKINPLIAREFSFVQELVWLPPRRNPFPRCTDKIVSDFRRLGILYRRYENAPLKGPGRNTNYRKTADNAASKMDADADRLIQVRRSLCKQLLSFQCDHIDLEDEAEAVLMDHIENAWGSNKQASIENWASKVNSIDFQALDEALQRRIDSIVRHVPECVKVDACQSLKSGRLRRHSPEDVDGLEAASEKTWVRTRKRPMTKKRQRGALRDPFEETQAVSSVLAMTSVKTDEIQNLSDKHLNDHDLVEMESNGNTCVISEASKQGSIVAEVNAAAKEITSEQRRSEDQTVFSNHDQELPLVLIARKENVHENRNVSLDNILADGTFELQHHNGVSQSERANCEQLRISSTSSERYVTMMDMPELEMTMKARICVDRTTGPEEFRWQIIFGLINHESCKIAVYSLSYWSLDEDSEVSTIKWPKGGVILKEAPSFLCYSCQIPCKGFSDSPRVAFSWQYSKCIEKHPASKGGLNEAGTKERELSIQEFETTAGREMADALGNKNPQASNIAPTDKCAHGSPFYKRLGSFLHWKDY